MTVEYQLIQEDLKAFNLHHHFHSPTARRQYYRGWFLPAFIWLLICTGIWYLADRERGTPLRTFLDLLPLFSGVVFHLAIFPWWYRWKVRKIMTGMLSEGQNRGLFSRRQVTISSEKITSSGEFDQTSTAWQAVEKVIFGREHAYIYTNALAAIIIPRRAVLEFDAFVRLAREYHETARA